jgi:hypothetical protein
VYDPMWSEDSLHVAQKETVSIPILKPGKSHSVQLAVGPFCLASSVYEVVERTVDSQLLCVL